MVFCSIVVSVFLLVKRILGVIYNYMATGMCFCLPFLRKPERKLKNQRANLFKISCIYNCVLSHAKGIPLGKGCLTVWVFGESFISYIFGLYLNIFGVFVYLCVPFLKRVREGLKKDFFFHIVLLGFCFSFAARFRG